MKNKKHIKNFKEISENLNVYNDSGSKIKNIIEELKNGDFYNGDLSDLGNTIGEIVGKYISEEFGFEKDDFISGIEHGISLSDGTHH